MTREERYAAVIEEVLGILIEEGNGSSSKEIHYAADLLFWARDGHILVRNENGPWVTSYERPVERA